MTDGFKVYVLSKGEKIKNYMKHENENISK
jgi:hypothetical protein